MKTGQVEQGQEVWPEAEMTSTGPSNAQHLLADGTSSSGTGQVPRGQAAAEPLFSPDPSFFSLLHFHSWRKPLIPQSCIAPGLTCPLLTLYQAVRFLVFLRLDSRRQHQGPTFCRTSTYPQVLSYSSYSKHNHQRDAKCSVSTGLHLGVCGGEGSCESKMETQKRSKSFIPTIYHAQLLITPVLLE